MHRQGDGEIWEHLAPKVRPTKSNKQKLAAAKFNLKRRSNSRPRTLHFRWKYSGGKLRLALCLGGTVVAAWPNDDTDIAALVETKMTKGEHLELRKDKAKVRRLALLLHAALEKAELGSRRKSATRQRKRLDYHLSLGVYRPVIQAPVEATWRCACESRQVYALSVESCQWCGKKAPRQRKAEALRRLK